MARAPRGQRVLIDVGCHRSGVNVPGVRMVDAFEGILGIEWIDGKSVRKLLPGGAEGEEEEEDDEVLEEKDEPLKDYGISVGMPSAAFPAWFLFTSEPLDTLMSLIGIEIAKMHLADVVHGDLTTSNMMLRLPKPDQSTEGTSTELVSYFRFPVCRLSSPAQVLIDFGLSYISTLVEDKAVDLYVLERAFASTHPDSEPLFTSVLTAYGTRLGSEWHAISRRLDDGR